MQYVILIVLRNTNANRSGEERWNAAVCVLAVRDFSRLDAHRLVETPLRLRHFEPDDNLGKIEQGATGASILGE